MVARTVAEDRIRAVALRRREVWRIVAAVRPHPVAAVLQFPVAPSRHQVPVPTREPNRMAQILVELARAVALAPVQMRPAVVARHWLRVVARSHIDDRWVRRHRRDRCGRRQEK